MMRYKTIINFCPIVFVFLSMPLQSITHSTTTDITKEEMSGVFEKLNNWFKNSNSYSLTITHTSYKNYQTNEPFEKSVGYFKKEYKNPQKMGHTRESVHSNQLWILFLPLRR